MSHASYLDELCDPSRLLETVNDISCKIIENFPEADYVACSGISGVGITACVSMQLQKEIFVVRKDVDWSDNSCRIKEFLEIDEETRTAVIIDDLISTGATMDRIINALQSEKIKVIGIILYHDYVVEYYGEIPVICLREGMD